MAFENLYRGIFECLESCDYNLYSFPRISFLLFPSMNDLLLSINFDRQQSTSLVGVSFEHPGKERVYYVKQQEPSSPADCWLPSGLQEETLLWKKGKHCLVYNLLWITPVTTHCMGLVRLGTPRGIAGNILTPSWRDGGGAREVSDFVASGLANYASVSQWRPVPASVKLVANVRSWDCMRRGKTACSCVCDFYQAIRKGSGPAAAAAAAAVRCFLFHILVIWQQDKAAERCSHADNWCECSGWPAMPNR